MLRKIVFTFVLSSLSFASFAGTYPTISFNENNCAAITKGNLTGCFLNKTNGYLGDYQMKQTFIYENGSSMETISNLGAMQPGFFTVISASSADLVNNKITSMWFSIIKGDADKYQVVPGCSTEFTDKSISKSVLAVYKINGALHCE